MENTPLVSIIIPTYNRQKTLPDTIQSVIRQTYKNWELIIVDDKSMDDTKNLIQYYSIKDTRIRYLLNDGPKGPSAARNHGINNARGEVIAFLDSDDQWVEIHLSDSIKALLEEKLHVCFSLWYQKNSKGDVFKLLEMDDERERFDKAMKELNPIVHDDRIIFKSPKFFERTCLKTIHICHINTMVFKKDIITKVGVFNERLFAGEDMDFIYRVLHDYDFCLIKDYHFIYNQGEDNIHHFVDRQNINLGAILSNADLVHKFTFCGTHTCNALSERKAFIKKSSKVKMKGPYILRCNDKIGQKYFTLGYMNQVVSKRKALFFLFKSLIYKRSLLKVKLGIHILVPFMFRDLDIGLDDLWLN